MDETSPTQGWWKAIDGRWYPPVPVPSTPPARPPRHARTDPGIPAGALQKPRAVFPGNTAVPAAITVAQSERPRRGPPRYWILAVLLVLTAASISAAGTVRASGDDARSKHTVTYLVTGSGASVVEKITYGTLQTRNGLSGELQVSDARLPWTRTFVTSGTGTSFAVSVETGPTAPSYVNCSIFEDGKLVSSNKAEGPYAVASCRGARPSGIG